MIVAVDGPAAAGKGTIARKLAHYFNLAYLDTGMLYRSVALTMIESGADLNDPITAENYARNFPNQLTNSSAIRTNKVSKIGRAHV